MSGRLGAVNLHVEGGMNDEPEKPRLRDVIDREAFDAYMRGDHEFPEITDPMVRIEAKVLAYKFRQAFRNAERKASEDK